MTTNVQSARVLGLSAILMMVAGCVSFQSKPIVPSETARAYEGRALDHPGLKQFLQQNLQREVTPWPLPSWDLQTLTLAAFYYHSELDVARAKWGVAEAGAITAGARPNPGGGVSSQYNTGAAPGVVPWSLGLSLDIPIETAGKRGYRATQAAHLSHAARLNIASVAWQVRARVRFTLLELFAARTSEMLLQRQEAIQAEMVNLLERRIALGAAAQLDVTPYRIALDQTRLTLAEARRQSAEAQVKVAAAVGVPVSALENIALSFDGLEHIEFTDNLVSAETRRAALVNRADILAALAEYEAAQSALQVEIAKQYPDVRLGPGYTWDSGTSLWSLGLSITLPLLNSNDGPIAEAQARRKQAAANFAALQARVVAELDQTMAGYRAIAQKYATAQTLFASRQKQLHSIEAQFNAGQEDRLTLAGAQLELAVAEIARFTTLVAAHQALGLLEDALQRPLQANAVAEITAETDPRNEETKP